MPRPRPNRARQPHPTPSPPPSSPPAPPSSPTTPLPLTAAIPVTAATARRFHQLATGLIHPHADIATALAHHGYVQIDPINVCGRMQDLILRNRVAGYCEGDLLRHLHGDPAPAPAEQRTAFEHHLPSTNILVAFPLDAWPHLLAEMRARSRRSGAWSGRLTPRERPFAEHILAELAARGPLSSEDIEDDGRRARRVWGSATLAKSTLQKLFFHGRVLISHRENNRRLYDLPERVLPAATLALPAPPAADTARWLAHLRLRQNRLVILKRAEFPLLADLVQPLAVEGGLLLHCLRSDLPLLAPAADFTTPPPSELRTPVSQLLASDSHRAALLAPLDPLIYDRALTRRLWNFDYTWEVYTPPAKRRRGYYALPLLSRDTLAGHVDAKADRPARRLVVVSRQIDRGHAAAATRATRDLARFLNLR